MANAQDVPGSSDAAPAAHLQVNSLHEELTRQHHSLEQQLHHLASMSYLTDAQQLEELTLKKKKLAIKDQLTALVAGARR
ncbi:MAG TPA: YdcH family protein [Vicinamibacterales bacterium]|nr:YdcH family protein [Vicinamibacterales bacterium]